MVKRSLTALFLAAFLAVLAGCGRTRVAFDKTIHVTVVGSDYFSVEDGNICTVGEDGTASFTLNMKPGYFVEKVGYEDCEIRTDGSIVNVTLFHVNYPTRVRIDCGELVCSITYYAEKETLERHYSLAHHIRPNTENGEAFQCHGYTLIGWNTASDGSGEHIGLGSRVSVPPDGDLSLYAEWSKWNDPGEFSYTAEGSGITITGWSGDSSVMSIPEYIDGMPIECIAAGAFENCRFNTVVFPKSLRQVERGAFVNCSFSELYLFDNIEEIFDDCFVDCGSFSTLHVNAIEPPRYMDQDRHANLADKYDILIENTERKKIIVYSGSSAFFSVDTNQMEDAFDGCVVINMAVNAFFNGAAQMEMIGHYLRDGDVFIHAPEPVGEYQCLNRIDMNDVRFFMALEANYDLLSLVDIRDVTCIFNGFTSFNRGRERKAAQSYLDYADYIDSRGNYSRYRYSHNADESITDEAEINLDRFSDREAMTRLNNYYERLLDKKVNVFLCNAPTNRQSLMKCYGDGYVKRAEDYDDLLRSATGENYPIILALSDCIYDGSCFYNTDFHLSSDATREHTQKLIEGLKLYFD